MRLAVLLLLRQKDAKAHICDLDGTISIAEHVVTLDVPMKNVVLVHALQAQSYLVQAPLAKVFRKVAIFGEHNFRHFSAVHQLKEDPKPVLIVIDFFALD